MSVVAATVTPPTHTINVTPTGPAHPPSLSAGSVAGIVIGTLIGGVLFITLVLYLLDRYTRHKFTRVANPAHDDAERAYLSGTSSQGSNLFTRHPQRPSVSSDPFMSVTSWPPLPSTSRVHSSASPPRLGPIFPDGQNNSIDLGEINSLVMSDTNLPAHQASSQPGSTTPPHARQTSSDDGATSPSTPTKSLFLHRVLKSRAQASDGVSLAHRSSRSFSTSRSTTLDSSKDVHGDEERLLAEAEDSAFRDAETAQRGEDEGKEDVESVESIYSQGSAPIDHAVFLSDPVSLQNGSLSVPRHRSSRRRSHTPASTELSPVAEVPDSPRILEGRAISRPVSAAANSSLEAQVSHRTADVSGGNLPLLASTNFGRDNATSASGSILSTAGWGSSSSGKASRYPSLAPSSIGQAGPRSDAGTDWHHPPSGLGGLSSLQMGALRNPHSPVEEQRELPAALLAGPTPVKRAHLREGTVSSLPEVERRDVMQGGIACIDVAL